VGFTIGAQIGKVQIEIAPLQEQVEDRVKDAGLAWIELPAAIKSSAPRVSST